MPDNISVSHPKRDLALAQFSQTYHRPNRLRETMPTLVRINADMGHDFSQNKRELNVFVQSSMKRRDVDGENSLFLIIFRDLLSMAPVSSVKSSLLRYVSVF